MAIHYTLQRQDHESCLIFWQIPEPPGEPGAAFGYVPDLGFIIQGDWGSNPDKPTCQALTEALREICDRMSSS